MASPEDREGLLTFKFSLKLFVQLFLQREVSPESMTPFVEKTKFLQADY